MMYRDERPYRSRHDEPPVTIYLLSGDQGTMDKIACMFCKRTITDIKGRIDYVVSTPTTLEEYDIAVNVLCKLCKQQYRFVSNLVHAKVEVQQIQTIISPVPIA